jgi:hypothetical protein
MPMFSSADSLGNGPWETVNSLVRAALEWRAEPNHQPLWSPDWQEGTADKI